MSTTVETTSPFLLGNYAPVHDELDEGDLEVTGAIPQGLEGHYLRNGANPAFPPLGAYHWFDGDGMIHSVHLDGGRARYRNRFVETVGLGLERAAGRSLYGGIANMVFPDPEVMAAEGGPFKNAANTSVISHAGRVLALWEGGFPTELNLDLETVGLHDFCGKLVGSMTAHPKVDPVTGEMVFFGYSPFAPYLRQHVVDASGALVHSTEIEIPYPVMLHDFNVTEHYVVFFIMPAVMDLAAGGGITWQPDHGTRIGIMARRGGPVQWIDTDAFHVFHSLNAYEDGDALVVDGCKTRGLEMDLSAKSDGPPDAPILHRWRIEPQTGRVHEQALDERSGEFPRVADSVVGLRHRYGYVPTVVGAQGALGFNALVRHDLERGTDVTYEYGGGRVTGEAVFAPDPAGTAEDDGWVLSFVYDAARDASELVVLDARDLAAGPVATVHLPRRVPFGFHGTWVPTA